MPSSTLACSAMSSNFWYDAASGYIQGEMIKVVSVSKPYELLKTLNHYGILKIVFGYDFFDFELFNRRSARRQAIAPGNAAFAAAGTGGAAARTRAEKFVRALGF